MYIIFYLSSSLLAGIKAFFDSIKTFLNDLFIYVNKGKVEQSGERSSAFPYTSV